MKYKRCLPLALALSCCLVCSAGLLSGCGPIQSPVPSLSGDSLPGSASSPDVSSRTVQKALAERTETTRAQYGEPAPKDEVTGKLTEEEISSGGFDACLYDGFTYEYKNHSVQANLSEITTLGANDPLLWPGSIVALDYRDTNTPRKGVTLPRKPVKLSLSREGTLSGGERLSGEMEKPGLDGARETLREILGVQEISAPTGTLCELSEIKSEEEFQLTVGVSASYAGAYASNQFGIKKTNYKTNALLKLTQTFFTVDMSQNENNDYFADSVTAEDVENAFAAGEMPAYVSVVYGRVALISIHTDLDYKELTNVFQAGYKDVASVEVGVKQSLSKGNTVMNYKLYGGGTGEGILGESNLDSLLDTFTQPLNTDQCIGMPIAYRFYALNDGALLSYRSYNEFTTKECVPIKVKNVRITKIYNVESEEEAAEAQLGETLMFESEILPANCVFEKKFSINERARRYAYIDEETGRLKLLSPRELAFKAGEELLPKDIVGDYIEITLATVQQIDGLPYTKKYTARVKVVKTPAAVLELSSDHASGQVYPGEQVKFFADVFPENATFDQVRYKIRQGNASFDQATGVLSIPASAEPNSEIVVYAESVADGVKSEPFTLVVKEKDEMNPLYDYSMTALKANGDVLEGKYLQTGASYTLLNEFLPMENEELLAAGLTVRLVGESVRAASLELKEGLTYTLCVYEDASIGQEVIVEGVYADGKNSFTQYLELMVGPNVSLVNGEEHFIEIESGKLEFSHVTFFEYTPEGKALGIQTENTAGKYDLDFLSRSEYCGPVNVKAEIFMRDGSSVVSAYRTHTHFAGGSGESGEPYLISNNRQLWNINRHAAGYFELTKDVEFFHAGEFSGVKRLDGIFEGNNHTITVKSVAGAALKINVSGAGSYGGLFNEIAENAVVANLKIEGLNVTSDAYHEKDFCVNAGGLCGVNYGKIQKVTIGKGTLILARQCSSVGGIAGQNFGKILSSSVSLGKIGENGDTGGIAGTNSGEISGCAFKDASVTIYVTVKNRSIGGIAGYCPGTVKDSKVENVTFVYYGSAEDMHKYFFTHCNCPLQPKAGQVVGHLVSKEKYSGCESKNCAVTYPEKDEHNDKGYLTGSGNESKYWFKNEGGKVGKIG